MSTVQGGQGNIVTSGLVLNLDAANPRSYDYPYNGTIWRDLSGNGNNGTLVNGVGYNSSNGGGLVFDGTNDTCPLPNNSTLAVRTGDFTFSCWIFPTLWNNNFWNAIFVTATSNGIWIGQNASNQFVLRAYAVADRLQCNTLPTLNVWTNVAITRLGTSVILYYNGVNVANSTTSQDFVQGTTYIGNDGQSGVGGTYFNGRISIISLYKNRGLSASEVLQNFNATRARFGV